jgi:nitroimidazol reductase NimA-like FMN-containing flavoprotein (pyridoxamine 5'-phosphate oxidase superfamily)
VRSADPRTGIEMLDREECLRLLATQEVGRVAVVDHGQPHVMPVNYVLDGDAVVFRTAAGTKLAGATGSQVAFEVDETDRARRSAWSVVVHGLAQEVTAYDAPALVDRIAAIELHPWAEFDKPHVLRIAPHTITGRRVRPTDKEALPHEGT